MHKQKPTFVPIFLAGGGGFASSNENYQSELLRQVPIISDGPSTLIEMFFKTNFYNIKTIKCDKNKHFLFVSHNYIITKLFLPKTFIQHRILFFNFFQRYVNFNVSVKISICIKILGDSNKFKSFKFFYDFFNLLIGWFYPYPSTSVNQ